MLGLISARGSDIVDPQPGFTPTLQCLGPLSRHAEDLSLVLKVLVGREKAALLRLDKQVCATLLRHKRHAGDNCSLRSF